MFVCMFVCMYLCMYVCMYVCMYTYLSLSTVHVSALGLKGWKGTAQGSCGATLPALALYWKTSAKLSDKRCVCLRAMKNSRRQSMTSPTSAEMVFKWLILVTRELVFVLVEPISVASCWSMVASTKWQAYDVRSAAICTLPYNGQARAEQ